MNLVMTSQQSNRRPPSVLVQYDLNNQNPTLGQLLNLHRAINRECVHRSSHSGGPDPHLAYGTIIQLTVYLSSQLLLCDGPNSDIFRETQLRALIAAFALLLHTEITKLAPPPYDELRGNIAGRFNDIVSVPTSDLQSRMRKANALFLIRLAAQYFSLIKRAEPVPDVLVPSILGLVLVGASVASGQYTGLHEIFRYADNIIGVIPGRESQYLNLPALQEITRRATTLLEEADIAIEDSGKRKAVEAAANDVKLVQDLLNIYLQDIPSRRRDSWNWPLTQLGLGPPSLNKWHFFYGLLDCAAQLVNWLRPEQISIELLKTFVYISEESEFEEFRWKIIEIFLVCFRAETGLDSLRETLRRFLDLDAPPDVSEFEAEAMIRILEEGRICSADAANSEPDRMTETASLIRTEQQRLELTHAAMSGNSERDSSEQTSSLSMRRVSTGNTTATTDTIESCPLENGPTYMRECSVRYTTDELALWEQDGDSQVHRRLRSPDFFRRLAGLFQKGFTHAGLSSDCRMVFFHNATKLHVYPVISRSTDIPAEGWPLVWNLGRHNPLADVSLSDRVVAISTQKAVELHLIGSSSANSQGPRIISHDNWDPSGLAIYENGLEVLVAVGYQRETKTSRQGRVFIYSSKFCWGGLEKETIAQSYDLPREDFPKHLNFDDQGKRLTCITAIGNSVLIWHLGSPNPFEITRNHHRPETDSDGVTSAVIYRSPNEQPYVLCSTSASTERYRSGGEWSFSSPIITTNEQVPQSVVHDFVAMKNHRQLVASAVSSKANIYAVLDKAGKVLILRLAAHEEGGIYTRDVSPLTLRTSLCNMRNSPASSTCLRFDPGGKKLYGVDAEGNLLIASFKPES